ncbi:hypothetical protein chiPu_0011910 [Chiloscyllium punctatum]|uniref:Uncharacterized protein n=1 Tax=Chiloscyllium punctatum TaxID=137246 RepID=A0A401SSS5_CHIPU|nr:hypothetical protein [Chiloscyllium punctatum]
MKPTLQSGLLRREPTLNHMGLGSAWMNISLTRAHQLIINSDTKLQLMTLKKEGPTMRELERERDLLFRMEQQALAVIQQLGLKRGASLDNSNKKQHQSKLTGCLTLLARVTWETLVTAGTIVNVKTASVHRARRAAAHVVQLAAANVLRVVCAKEPATNVAAVSENLQRGLF